MNCGMGPSLLQQAAHGKQQHFWGREDGAKRFENNERALVALCDDDAAAFCTFTNRDEMSREYGCGPLIGFLFVAEKYRGNRLSEQMVNAACNVAKEQGFSAIYLMSGEAV